MKRTTKHVFAIVRVDRVDEFQSANVSWNNRITVKEILMTEEEARVEVERLNGLNENKGCVYFAQVTRLVDGYDLRFTSPQAERVLLTQSCTLELH